MKMVAATSGEKRVHTTARHGELTLGFVRKDEHTIMKQSFFRTPLQVMRFMTDTAGCATVYMLSPTGGIVQGDRYNIHITVAENAHALVTTLAATKVYRMPDTCATQDIHIEVMAGGILEFVPDGMILFEDADLYQTIDVTLHDGASIILQDSVMPGRLASGESLNFKRYNNRIVVRDTQGLLLYEQQDITPDTQNLARLGVLEEYRTWASWYLLGELARTVDELDSFHDIISGHDATLGSVTRLHRDGVSVRLLGHYLSPITSTLENLRNRVRTDYMHLPVSHLRK